MGWKVLAYGLLGVKHGARRPLDIFRHRWDDNINMDCKEIGWEGVDRIHIAGDWDRWQAVVNTVMNVWVP
jgi:hypothetical protein